MIHYYWTDPLCIDAAGEIVLLDPGKRYRVTDTLVATTEGGGGAGTVECQLVLTVAEL